MASDIDICSNALLLIGDERISAFDESTGGLVAEALYPSVKENMLSLHPWRFSMTQFQLNLLTITIPAEVRYQFAFQLPAGYLKAYQVYPGVDFEIRQDVLYSNVNSLLLEYQFVPDEAAFPPWFVKLMEYAMAAELANPVTENSTLADQWTEKAEVQFGRAMAADSQQQPNRQWLSQPFLEIHR